MTMNISEVFHSRYELLQRVGRGGFSEVWKALDMRSGVEVAIKVFRQQDSEGIALCREEYLKTFDFQHPNILTPFHFDVSDDRTYIVMKFLNGGTLADHLGNLNAAKVEDLIRQLGSALKYLHSRPVPVIHGDIKPDNILIDENGNYFLTDFGISTKLIQRFTETLRADSIVDSSKGVTPMAYRSPESFKYKNWEFNKTGPFSDIWSAGVTVYQAIYNSLPFNGEGGLGQLILMKSGNHSLEEIIEFEDGDFTRFNAIILAALQLNPQQRATFLGEVVDSPEPIITSESISDPPLLIDDTEGISIRKKKESRAFLYPLLAIFAIGVVLLVIALSKGGKEKEGNNPPALSQEAIQTVDSIQDQTVDNSDHNVNDKLHATRDISTDEKIAANLRTEAKTVPVNNSSPAIQTNTPEENHTTPIDQSENVSSAKENIQSEKAEPVSVETRIMNPSESREKTKSRSVTIKPNIPIPLMLNEDIGNPEALSSGSKISFVVADDVLSYGDVFLRKGQKVQAVVKKVTRDKIKIHFPDIYTTGNTKLKSPNLDNFDIKIGKDQKGIIFYPVTSSYQYNVNVK